MRELMRLGSQLVRTWWFWAFVLLALPNCALQTGGLCSDGSDGPTCPGDPPPCEGPQCDCNKAPDCPPPCDPATDVCPCDPATDPAGCMPPPTMSFDPGPAPVSDAIMCDIPVPVADPIHDNCATAAEANDPANLKTSQAATALASGQNSMVALDWSNNAKSDCGGLPKKVVLLAGNFPDGMTLCINCTTQIPNVYATSTKACIAKCIDLVNASAGFKPSDVAQYCIDNAHTSVNYDKNSCDPKFHGACTGGTPDPAFFDPRRHPEATTWSDLIGVQANGSNLTRTTPASGQNLSDWTEGAASFQTISHGDAWVDFSSPTIDGAHAIGVRESRAPGDVPCYDISNCQDADTSLAGIGYGIDLNHLDQVYAIEGFPFNTPGPFGANYSPTERFRIHVTDNNDGTARVSFSRIVGACADGQTCTEDNFYTAPSDLRYPLRVDATFRDPSTFANVNIVRIQQ